MPMQLHDPDVASIRIIFELDTMKESARISEDQVQRVMVATPLIFSMVVIEPTTSSAIVRVYTNVDFNWELFSSSKNHLSFVEKQST